MSDNYAVFAIDGGGNPHRLTRWSWQRKRAEARMAEMLNAEDRKEHPEDYLPLCVLSQDESSKRQESSGREGA